jgi:signal transduction histidine kinase
MSSNAGISCFHIKEGRFVNYFPNDGIISNEYSQNGYFKNAVGELFFASPEGILLFNPAAIRDNAGDPPVILSSYAVNYTTRNAYPVTLAKSLDLTWSEKTVSFEFSALDYSAADKIDYSYKLEGFDNDWVIASHGQRIATYTTLPFGKYTFKVRIRKNAGEWSREYLGIAVNVVPPFWFSWWFILAELVIGLLLLIFIIRYYSQRKLRKRLRESEVQRKVQYERERISRDLHDNVGAHLTYIIQSLDNISYKIEKNPAEKPVERIDSLGEFARGTMQQLRETIWAINKEEISVPALKDKIQEHLAKLATAAGNIKFAVHLSEETDAVLKPSQAIHIFRLVQESLNNAIKHASATAIEVRLSLEQKKLLIVSIRDDGKGFDANEAFEGHYGLENMKSRVSEMGGKLEIVSAPLKGTEIKFAVPV